MKRLMDYLPENYPDSKETVTFQEAFQPEMDAVWKARDSLLAQLNPYTADWGLDYWEDALGIPASGHLGLELRRRQIAAKLQGRAATTPEVVKTVAETLLGVNVKVIEVFSEYRVELVPESGGKLPAGLDALKRRMDEIMPAHLDWGFVLPLFLELPITPCLGPRQGVTALPPFQPGAIAPAFVYVTPLLGVNFSTVALPMAAGQEGG